MREVVREVTFCKVQVRCGEEDGGRSCVCLRYILTRCGSYPLENTREAKHRIATMRVMRIVLNVIRYATPNSASHYIAEVSERQHRNQSWQIFMILIDIHNHNCVGLVAHSVVRSGGDVCNIIGKRSRSAAFVTK